MLLLPYATCSFAVCTHTYLELVLANWAQYVAISALLF